MKTKDFTSLARQLLPNLPGFTIKGQMMLLHPPKWGILRGFCFEGSSFDKTSFYVWAFVLPLYVPRKYLSFSFGDRIRHNGSDRWNVDDPNLVTKLAGALKTDGLPFLLRIESLEDFLDLANTAPGADNPHTQEAIAYGLIRIGQFKQADVALDELIRTIHIDVCWEVEIADRARYLKEKLSTNPSDAQRQLDDWESETLHNLRLKD